MTSSKHGYKEVVHSVKEIDFRNLRYNLSGEQFVLRNGSVHKDQRIEGTDAMEHFDVSLDRIWYSDFKDGQPHYAVVSLWVVATVVSSSDIGFTLLFNVVDDHPVIAQQFEYDLHTRGTGSVFNKETGVLTIKSRARDDSAHCCAENLETDEFKWQGQTDLRVN